MRRTPARGPRRLFFLLVVLPMFCVFPYLRTVNNPNEFVRVFTAIALVEHHTFSIDEPVKTWGWVNDMARVPSKVDGQPHYFMVKAPGVVYASLPGYFLFSKVIAPLTGHHYPTATSSQEERLWWLQMSTWSLRIFTSSLPCFLFLLWFEKYLRDFTPDPLIRFAAVAATGLGTNFLAYVLMFASHSQYASLAFIAFATLEREKRLSRGDARARRFSRAVLAGFCTSACVMFEYQSLFLAVILTVFGLAVFWRPTRLLGFAAGGLFNVPLVMYFQWRAYGNPLTPGHQMLETPSFAAAHNQGLWGIVWPSWEHIQALAVDPGFGFFGTSPFMWLGLLAIPLMIFSPMGDPSRRRAARIATIVWGLCCTTLFCVNAGFVEWRGGWTVGPRYLVACAPFFAFGAACTMERIAGANRARRAIVRGVGGGLALASVLTIGTVGLVYDTLPESTARPFAEFSIPMMWTGHVPHHVGEWFGWESTTPWYLACGAMLAAPVIAGLWPAREGRGAYGARAVFFVFALALGLVPAFYPEPADGSKVLVLHPATRALASMWEPPGRDRITLLRNEAERYGVRRPCMWYHLADLDRVLGNDGQAARDESKTAGTPREKCPRRVF